MNDCSTESGPNPAGGYAISGMDSIKTDAIPAELKALDRWVAWKAVDRGDGKKPTKIPVNPMTGGNAMSDNPSTWGAFERAVRRAAGGHLAGIGLMFAGDDLVGIDLDDVMADGAFSNPLAEAFVRSMDTYTEVSPSGRGVKMWIRSSVPPGRCTGTIRHGGESVAYETYHRGRWFAVTGHVLPQYGGGQVQERTARYSRMLELGASPKGKPKGPAAGGGMAAATAGGAVADEEAMLRAALSHIDADNEGVWFRMGCCLKSWGAKEAVGGQRAKALWDEWSRSSAKFDDVAQDERWGRMEPDKGLTIGTVFAEAEDEGYCYGDAVGADDRQYHIDGTPEWTGMLDAWHVEFMSELSAMGAKPVVELHSVGGRSHVKLTDAASRLGDALAECGELFSRNGTVVYVRDGATIPVEAHDLAAVADRHASLVLRKETKGKNGPKEQLVQTTATPGQCQDYLAAREFRDRLPQLRLISKCPVLVDDGKGGLRTVGGYDRNSGVLVTGGAADAVPLEEAKRLIEGVLEDFDFATPSDRSRAIAAMLTPAMVMGGLLPGRAPIDLGEADDSQAGKGYRQKLIAASYNDSPTPVLQRKGGTGSMEESYCAALIGGACFISLDNVRGRIDSPLIESSLTEDFCDARMPYGKPMQVDMRRTCIAMTSNDARLTTDLSKRCSPVKIRRRPDGYGFREYPEGDLLAHVRANQGRYLGAVFAVVRAWAAAGRPMEADRGHDFRGWARTMDWIVTRVFGGTPLCNGVRETQARMANPNRGWAREVALAAIRGGCAGRPMRAHQIVRMLEDIGAELPGVEPGSDMSDDANFRKANQAVGRRLSVAFGRPAGDAPDVLGIDDMTITRSKEEDDGKSVFSYVFSAPRTAEKPSGGDQAENGRPLGGNTELWETGCGCLAAPRSLAPILPPNGPAIPPNAPPNVPPEKPLIPPNPPNVSGFFLTIGISPPSIPTGCVDGVSVRKNGGLQADQAEIPPYFDDGFLSDDPPDAGNDTGPSDAADPFCDWGDCGSPAEDWPGVACSGGPAAGAPRTAAHARARPPSIRDGSEEAAVGRAAAEVFAPQERAGGWH